MAYVMKLWRLTKYASLKVIREILTERVKNQEQTKRPKRMISYASVAVSRVTSRPNAGLDSLSPTMQWKRQTSQQEARD